MRFAILVLALLTLPPAAGAADFVACQTGKGHDARYWQWRIIDGRRCWYPSRRRIDKSSLRWIQDQPPHRQPRASLVVEPLWHPPPSPDSATEQIIGKLMHAVISNTLRPEPWPWEEPSTAMERDDSVLGEICCWPPLDRETNWLGIAALLSCMALAVAGVTATLWVNQRGV